MSSVIPLAVSHPNSFSASLGAGVNSVIPLSVSGAVPISANLGGQVKASIDITGASDLLGMSACDVVEEILAMWGILCLKTAPDYARDRAINDLNSALQTVWNQAENRDYWSKETLTLTLATAVASQDLANDVQNVTGNCRLSTSKRTLIPIGSLGELETFTDLYLEGDTVSEPIGYHIERKAQAANDPVKCVFHVAPAPTVETAFLIEVVKEAPRFSPVDLVACTLLPIPHRYVETLLLPIARYRATSYYLFDSAANKSVIEAEYSEARVALGMADPLPGDAGDNNRDKKEGRRA